MRFFLIILLIGFSDITLFTTVKSVVLEKENTSLKNVDRAGEHIYTEFQKSSEASKIQLNSSPDRSDNFTFNRKVKKVKYAVSTTNQIVFNRETSSAVRKIRDVKSKEEIEGIKYRLPKNIIPKHYTIKLIPHIIPGNFTFDGFVEIITEVLQNTTEVILHIDNITCNTVSLESNSLNILIINTVHDEKHQFLRITVADTIISGSQLIIKIKYKGYLSQEKRGFYRDYYIDNSNQAKWFAVTHLVPLGARRMFPCFDEPDLRATFQLNVSRTADFKVISSTILNSTIKESDRYLDIFERSPVMPTYFVSLILSDLNSTGETLNQLAWANEEANPKVVHSALQKDSEFLKYLEEFSRLKIQLENWPLVAYNGSILITNPDYISRALEQQFANDIIYESALGYFGYQTSPHWWKDAWLSTGLADYFLSTIHSNKLNWDANVQFVVDQLQPSMLIDSFPLTHPMSRNVYNPTEIQAMFDTVSYKKGASVLRMMEHALYPTFRNGISIYKDRKIYQSAKPEDLYLALQAVVDRDSSVKLNTSVQTIMDSWVTQAGYPVLNVNISKGVATLSQERFLLTNPFNVPINNIWWIPITWTSSLHPNFTDTTPKSWLSKSSDTIAVDEISNNDWIIFNTQQTGYYRVNYDDQTWNKIIQFLNSPNFYKIHEVNRAAILDDLFNFARSGHVDYATAFSASLYLSQETSYIPWKVALSHFDYLDKRITNKNFHNLFKTHIGRILEPVYETMKLGEMDNTNYIDPLLRANIVYWVCKYNNPYCLTKTTRVFKDWKADRSNQIPINLRYPILCGVMKNGAQDKWVLLWHKYLKTNYETERNIIAKALACTRFHKNLDLLLLNAINKTSTMRPQESMAIFSAVYNSGALGVDRSIKLFNDHFNKIYDYFQDNNKIKLILKGLASQLITKEQLLLFNNFVTTYSHQLSPIEKAVDSYAVEAELEINQFNIHMPKIVEYLGSRKTFNTYHLEKQIRTVAYDVYISLDLEHSFTLNGFVEITINVTKDISTIVLNANKLEISGIKIAYTNTLIPVSVSSFRFDDYRKLNIYLSTIVTTGSQLSLTIKYTGEINTKKGGLYRAPYTDDDGKVHWVVATQFRKYGASAAFPCFDEPRNIAKFLMRIERPNHYHILSNLELTVSWPSTKLNGSVDSFELTELMPPHDIVFIITDFKAKDTELHSNAAKILENVRELNQGTLNLLEKYTRSSNPLPNLNVSVIPNFNADTPENWHLIALKESDLLSNKDNTPTYFMKDSEATTVRKLANMWLNKLVIPNRWEYIWLNEGFAEFLQWSIMNKLHPEWRLMDQFIVDKVQKGLLKDSFTNTKALNNQAIDDETADYSKVVSLINMMHYALGRRMMEDSYHRFLRENHQQGVQPSDLWDMMQTVRKAKNSKGSKRLPNQLIPAIMNTWTNQAGYPVVHANRFGNTVTLQQERFFITRNNISSEELYYVPITMATASNSYFQIDWPIFWLEAERGVVKDMLNIMDKWFILNIQQTGFYRVNYDEQSWINLIDTLNSDGFGGIPEINRAQIIDDLLNLARAGYISYDLALNGTEYLSKEKGYLPWKAFFNAVSFLYDQLNGENIGAAFTTYLLKIIKPAYVEVGFEERDNDTQIDELNRNLILSWACKLDYPQCIDTSKKLFKEWQKDSSKFILPDAKQTVFCTAIKYGDFNDWEFLWKNYLEARMESEKLIILNALGCSQKETIIDKYLDFAMLQDKLISDQHVSIVFASVYSSGKHGLDATLKYLKKNYYYFEKRFNSWDLFIKLVSNIAEKISTSDQISQLQFAGFDTEELININKKLNESILWAEDNLKWHENHITDIEHWLMNKTDSSMQSMTNIDKHVLIISVLVVILILELIFMILLYFFLRNRGSANVE